jgi:hypothetical protein
MYFSNIALTRILSAIAVYEILSVSSTFWQIPLSSALTQVQQIANDDKENFFF